MVVPVRYRQFTQKLSISASQPFESSHVVISAAWCVVNMLVPVRYLQVMNCQSQYPTDQAFHMRWYQRHWCVVSMLLPVRHKSASAYSHQIELADVVVSAALVCCKRVVANDILTIYRLSTLTISLIKPSTYGGVSGIGRWSTPWCR
jgi:hypothetical protein